MTGGMRTGGKPPWEKEAEPDAGSFGRWLRRQREMREISLRDIAERTKISLRYLEAMEDDRFDLLPASIFAKGFLREYARYVGLSPDEVVNHYLSVHQPQAEEPGDKTLAGAVRSQRSWTGLVLALAALLLLALIAGLAYLAERRRADDDRTSRPPAAASVPVEPVAAVALPPEPPPAPPAPPARSSWSSTSAASAGSRRSSTASRGSTRRGCRGSRWRSAGRRRSSWCSATRRWSRRI